MVADGKLDDGTWMGSVDTRNALGITWYRLTKLQAEGRVEWKKEAGRTLYARASVMALKAELGTGKRRRVG